MDDALSAPVGCGLLRSSAAFRVKRLPDGGSRAGWIWLSVEN
jgi:hypothetical protein